jgi:hypothetical protein
VEFIIIGVLAHFPVPTQQPRDDGCCGEVIRMR